MKRAKRMSPAARKDDILAAAIKLAEGGQNYQRLTRDHIASAAGVAPALVSAYFGTMPNLRRDIMRAAVRDGSLRIIAQGLAAGDTQAKKAAPAIRAKAAELLGV